MAPRTRWTLAFALAFGLWTSRAHAVPLRADLGGPEGFGVHRLETGRGVSSEQILLDDAFPGGFRFFWQRRPKAWVNTNGTVSFFGPFSERTPSRFPQANLPLIAAYWSDVDTRGGGSVWWHLEPHRFVVTWHDVGYGDSHGDRRNDFQLIVEESDWCGPGARVDVEFRFHRCEWTTGDASGGVGGLGGVPALVGLDAGNRRDFVALPFSLSPSIQSVCTSSNVPGGPPGLWRFRLQRWTDRIGCSGGGGLCALPGLHGLCAMGLGMCGEDWRVPARCEQRFHPRPPRCNGLDNDCDGEVDLHDSLCGPGERCTLDGCRPRCAPDRSCPPGQRCRDDGACISTLCDRTGCVPDERCEEGFCRDQCHGVSCPAGRVCSFGTCVDACEGVLCPGNMLCEAGECVNPCTCRLCPEGARCAPDGRCYRRVPDAGLPDATTAPDVSVPPDTSSPEVPDPPDAGAPPDRTPPSVDATERPPPPQEGGCGCAVETNARDRAPWALAVVALLVGARRVRRWGLRAHFGATGTFFARGFLRLGGWNFR